MILFRRHAHTIAQLHQLLPPPLDLAGRRVAVPLYPARHRVSLPLRRAGTRLKQVWAAYGFVAVAFQNGISKSWHVVLQYSREYDHGHSFFSQCQQRAVHKCDTHFLAARIHQRNRNKHISGVGRE